MQKIYIPIVIAFFAVLPIASHAAPAKNCTVANTVRDAAKAEGKRFSVVIEGPNSKDVQDVILIPGLSSPRAVWEPTVAALAGCYRIHSIQIRGFGDDAGINATGPVLDAFITELADYIDDEIVGKGRGRPAIIGHSMGGLSAAMIAARYPLLVDRILIQDSLPFIGLLYSPYATVDAVRPQAAKMRDAGLAAGKQPATEDVLQRMSATPDGRAQVAKWSDSADNHVSMQVFYDVLTTDIRPELPAIKASVTVLYPYDTIVGPVEQVDALYTNAYKGVGALTMRRVDNSRHFIMIDQPAVFAEEVAAFLTK